MNNNRNKNRKTRVRNMLNNNKNKRKTLKRMNGSRHIVTIPFQVTNIHGVNWNNEDLDEDYSLNLQESRFSIEKSKPIHPFIGLNPNESRMYAELSHSHRHPQHMLNSIQKVSNKINGKNNSTSVLTQNQEKLYTNLSRVYENQNKKKKSLGKIQNRIYSLYGE